MYEKKDKKWSGLHHHYYVVLLRMLISNNHLISTTGAKLDWKNSVFNKPTVRCIRDFIYKVFPALDLTDFTYFY